jgi:hypothetical protein
MPSTLRLYIAEEDDAEVIAAGEYDVPPDSFLSLPGDIDEDDLSALSCLLGGCRVDPEVSACDDEPLAEGAEAVVYRVLPEFVERLSVLAKGGCRTVVSQWAAFLGEGEDEEGWWTEARAQRVLRRLSALACRARSRGVPMLLATEARR